MRRMSLEQVLAFRLAREWLNQVKWTIDAHGPSVWYCQPAYRNNTREWLKVKHPEYLHLERLVYKCALSIWPIVYCEEIDQYVFIEEMKPENVQSYADIAPFIPHFAID